MPDSIVLDNLGILLGQLVAEQDEIEKDIALLGKFSGSREDHRQFADSVRSQQRAAERIQQQLLADIEDCDNAKRQAELEEPLEREEKRSRALQRAFRLALLQYRPNAAGAAKQERELLLSGATTPAELRKRKVRAGNATLNAAADVTTALQETVSMMDAEIEKSAGNIIAMQESSAKLKKTQDEYSTLDSVLRTSKSLIQSLEQADALDRWLMLGGLVLFSLVVFNILRKRIWIPGLSTLFSLIRYLVLSVVSRIGKDSVVAAVSTSSPLVVQQLATSTAVSELPTALVTSLVALVSESVLVTETAQASADSQPSTLDTLSSTRLIEEETPLIEVHPQDDAQDDAADDDAQVDSPVDDDTQEDDPADDAQEDNSAANDDVTQPEEQADDELPIVVEEPVVSMEEEPEEPRPVIDQRKIYTLPVERPVREEL
ncbi:Vesicle transport protein S20 [Coemansia sp. RSA 455]|nr:Vesicle transport protein S20 [Coemansia sp. S17]KAJ2072439.1 Vesicle transport protein S20 [Coemansia sp. S155-1]KAJ2080258.1 Vesicle transport protein S20 [Coemansia sp. S142-1]KAJ2249452.1 Vesicle transport protein S20 [Coemansia sp. RSA 455]